jgi:ornithine--oxo-acid transaminase
LPPTAVSTPAALYAQHVNPQWARLLDLLQMNVRYTRCSGAELFDSEGRRILDFMSGYCVHNAGHNHPKIVLAIKTELDRCGPAMLQSHIPEIAGELAAALCARAGGQLRKVFFCSSGSEGVEAAIKFARAHAGRPGLIYADRAFHGLTCGALSLMGDPSWREGFGPLLADAQSVPFGDIGALERALSGKRAAAFIVEPVQAEGGVNVPGPDYLPAAQALCRRYGALLVLDEIQTGMYRTGRFLAAHHFGLEPDIVILAKALSGGLVPCGAVMMSDRVYQSVYSSLRRAVIHTSTFSENSLAMRAALATLEVLEEERLGERAQAAGARLRGGLEKALRGYEMIAGVRGMGLLCGIVFQPPRHMRLKIPFEAFRKIHLGMFGQMLVMRLFREKAMLTQVCGNNFMVLKAAPPLVIREEQIDEFIAAVREVVEFVHSSVTFWSDALNLARKVVNI